MNFVSFFQATDRLSISCFKLVLLFILFSTALIAEQKTLSIELSDREFQKHKSAKDFVTVWQVVNETTLMADGEMSPYNTLKIQLADPKSCRYRIIFEHQLQNNIDISLDWLKLFDGKQIWHYKFSDTYEFSLNTNPMRLKSGIKYSEDDERRYFISASSNLLTWSNLNHIVNFSLGYAVGPGRFIAGAGKIMEFKGFAMFAFEGDGHSKLLEMNEKHSCGQLF